MPEKNDRKGNWWMRLRAPWNSSEIVEISMHTLGHRLDGTFSVWVPFLRWRSAVVLNKRGIHQAPAVSGIRLWGSPFSAGGHFAGEFSFMKEQPWLLGSCSPSLGEVKGKHNKQREDVKAAERVFTIGFLSQLKSRIGWVGTNLAELGEWAPWVKRKTLEDKKGGCSEEEIYVPQCL